MLCCAVVIVLRLVRVQRYVVVQYVVLFCVVSLRCVVLCFVWLCFVMFCFVVLCCILLCSGLLLHVYSVIPGVRYKRGNSIKEEHHRDG